MNSELLESQWVQAKDFLRDKWGRLTEDDLRQINGRYDILVDKLQMRYGYTKDQAEDEVRKWNISRETTSPYGKDARSTMTAQQSRPFQREDRAAARREDNSSLFMWLLALAIPLLLLATYFASMKTPETTATTAPTSAQEFVTVSAQTPADQSLAQSIRQALIANSFQFQDLRNIQLSAGNGEVTVSGYVANAQEKDRINTILQNIVGVRRINNQLEIRS